MIYPTAMVTAGISIFIHYHDITIAKMVVLLSSNCFLTCLIGGQKSIIG